MTLFFIGQLNKTFKINILNKYFKSQYSDIMAIKKQSSLMIKRYLLVYTLLTHCHRAVWYCMLFLNNLLVAEYKYLGYNIFFFFKLGLRLLRSLAWQHIFHTSLFNVSYWTKYIFKAFSTLLIFNNKLLWLMNIILKYCVSNYY